MKGLEDYMEQNLVKDMSERISDYIEQAIHNIYNKYPHDNITVTNQFCAKLLINLYSIVYAIYFFRTFVCY